MQSMKITDIVFDNKKKTWYLQQPQHNKRFKISTTTYCVLYKAKAHIFCTHFYSSKFIYQRFRFLNKLFPISMSIGQSSKNKSN